MVTIVDPHIKKDDGYFLSKEASSLSLFVKDKDLKEFEGWCWPGNSNWIDFLNPKAREFWKEKLSLENYHGSTKNLYIWNDMNEVSVFSGPEITMPKDNIHHEGVEHRDVHNIYGLLQQRSTAEGLSARNNERPFVLSRAFFAGSNRYGAIWTGDNMAEWSHLKASIPMLLSISLAGLPFAGADVGGFFGNPEPELLARWYQLGAFQPFFRAHAHIDTKRREPWLFGEPYTTIIRNAIGKRYKLLPYIYTLFYESHVTGIPVMRPLFFEYPNDNEIFQKEESYLLGSSLLVQGVFNKGQEQVDVFLPGRDQVWFEFETGKKLYSGSHSLFYPLEKGIPVFVKGGSIIPIKDVVRRSSSLMFQDPYTLIVALDENQQAKGFVYQDDEKSFNYLKNEFVLNEISFQGNKLISNPNGSFGFDARKVYANPANFKNAYPFAESDLSNKDYLKNTLNKIIIYNVKAKPNNVYLSAESLNRANKTRQPPFLSFMYNEADHILIIKQPGCFLSEKWSLTLK